MKVLVTGAKGQLGKDVVAALENQHISVCGVDKDDFDLTDATIVKQFIAKIEPDVIIHCAAFTSVEQAEEDAAVCLLVNEYGTRCVAEAAKEVNAAMVYISTDYVFSGNGETPFETNSPKKPLNVYGTSKLLGEETVKKLLHNYFIVRISWAFGPHGNNFVKTMLQLGSGTAPILVVDDQIGSPTYTPDLADFLVQLIQTNQYGIYHATNEGECSWYQFACEILKDSPAEVVPVFSADFPAKAIRPKNSRLSKQSLDRAGFSRLPHWKDALHRFLEENSSIKK